MSEFKSNIYLLNRRQTSTNVHLMNMIFIRLKSDTKFLFTFRFVDGDQKEVDTNSHFLVFGKKELIIKHLRVASLES